MNNIAKEIDKALRQYTKDVEEKLEKGKEKVAKEAVKELKAESPKGATGSYAKGWTRKKVGSSQVIHNKTDYQLTHLLEYGHAKKNGGRVAPRPHIKKVEERAIEKFEKIVEEAIK